MPITLITTGDPVSPKLLDHAKAAKEHSKLTLAVKYEHVRLKLIEMGVPATQAISLDDLFDEYGRILVPDPTPMEYFDKRKRWRIT